MTTAVPAPPAGLLPGRMVPVPGRGELFTRDSGGDGPAVLLLHGWTASADLNWFASYAPLVDAGYRVIAPDHRGHGRGPRGLGPFRLEDCAADAAALLEALEIPAAAVVGYSMGGPIAQLLARQHPDRVTGLVMCATASNWTTRRQRAIWRTLRLPWLAMTVAPRPFWRRAVGGARTPRTRWLAAELTRGSAADILEAGRELAAYDARTWLAGLGLPAVSVVTTLDTAVPPASQRELAALLRAPTVEVAADHLAAISRPAAFNPALLNALARLA